MHKKCFYCGSKTIVRDGFSSGKQRFRCKCCGRRYTDRKRIVPNRLLLEYTIGKQSLSQLAERHRVSSRTIVRHLERARSQQVPLGSRKVVLLMDATYRNRSFGILFFKDAITGAILWHKFLEKKETIQDYIEGVAYIEQRHTIVGEVCDGLKGLIGALRKHPIQHCQFHQVKTIRRYLTRHPKSQAGKELLALAYLMCKTDKESFAGAFGDWYERHETYVNERSKPDEQGHTHYMHRRLRSAYLSLKRNMPYLWVWYDHIELHIPNTNNSLEAFNAKLKAHMRLHNGMKKARQKTFIEEYIRLHNEKCLAQI